MEVPFKMVYCDSREERNNMREEWIGYYTYLEELRRSGVTNMYGAVPYLQDEFALTKKEAIEILTNWMKNYEEIMEFLGGETA